VNFTKQNNPAVVTVLVAILIGALYGVFLQIKHVQAAMAADNAAHKTAPQTVAAPIQAAASSRAVLMSYSRPAFSHDPFEQPIEKSTRVSSQSGLRTVEMPRVVHVRQPPILPSATSEPLRVRPLPVAEPVKPVSTERTTTPSTPAQSDQIDVNSLRLSAILKGPNMSAIVERAGQPAISVTVGAKIGDYKVDKIGEDGIVLSNSSGIYTISLASDTGAQTQETANVAR
jgi:hypothetical protein